MLARFIAAINTLNQPYIAIIVVIMGCVFDIACQKYGISNDAATGIIGAGIGLLTGQALSRPPGQTHMELDSTRPLPTPPAAPAQTPKEK